jgi:predicted aminopeptidase
MRWIISIPLLLLLSGCADMGYYWHNANGHLSVMNQRTDIDELLADDQLDPELRKRLQLVQEIRRFSIERLDLPANDSYASYVELDRPYVVQNIFAAPEFSTRLYEWCYPVIGCASYRGYYDEARMLAYSDDLKSSGLEVYIGKVSAYSTLGWFDDPVLSSFVNWPDYRLAGLLFHELTHQQIYIDNDTTFNESLASAVQQVGTELWLESRHQSDQLDQLTSWSRYRDEVIALIESTREQLAEIYADDSDDAGKRESKVRIFTEARDAHTEIAVRHEIKGGFTHWFAGELNNAKIGSVAAYNSLTPAFINMIRAYKLDFALFFEYAEAVGDLEKSARNNCLEAWSQNIGLAATSCPKSEVITATAF